MHDIIIIGGGPAGLTAATYACRAGKSVLVIEKNAFGGQITWSPRVENFPGFVSVSGVELGDKLLEQAMAQGAEVELDEVTAVTVEDGVKRVACLSGAVFESRALIVAVGARPRPLGVAREEELVGSGVGYCAVCDGAFYADRPVAVCGGGSSALQDALLLSETCSRVTLIHRRDSFRGDDASVARLREKANVEFVYNSTVTKLNAEKRLKSIEVTNKLDGSVRTIELNGLFVAVGRVPENQNFADIVDLDAAGYIPAGEDCHTSAPGIFVAGDNRAKALRQLVTATADGAMAATEAVKYINEL